MSEYNPKKEERMNDILSGHISAITDILIHVYETAYKDGYEAKTLDDISEIMSSEPR